MNKLIALISLLFVSNVVLATDSWVSNATITKVEFYGNQFTLYFDKTHSATACGHPMSVVAINTASEPGKSHYSFFLAAYSANRQVSVKITDSTCNGDRPTIKQIIGH